MSGEKTEDPTPQKKKKARQEGQIARSPDVGAWLGMLAATFFIPWTMEAAVTRARDMLTRIPAVIERPELNALSSLLSEALIAVGLAAGPLALGMLVVGVAAAGAQGGIHVATKLFMPKFSRLNPMKGIKQKLGPQAWWEGAKALIKTVVLGAVLYHTIRELIPVLMFSGSIPLAGLLNTIKGEVLGLIRVAAAAGLVMAAADYLVVRRRTMKQIRMSKQEVKDEHKRSEGDPQQKGHIRSRQMAMSRNRMMTELPKADVVMVNPTHVAVALRYDPAKGAPRVVAKGAGAIADKIREVATEHRIPLVQDVPLARALYSGCEIGQEIPPQFYGAVAKVLAFVMGLKKRGSAAGLHRNPAPSVPAAA
jgi:flagellar biosynthetic protein FlhB